MNKFVVLDTETTGLDRNAEIIEIGIVDQDGRVLIDTKVKCQDKIPKQASVIHGIKDEDLADAPEWTDVWPKVRDILESAEQIVIYNREFDLLMLLRTCMRYYSEDDVLRTLKPMRIKTVCAMLLYADEYNYGRWEKLTVAAHEFGVDTSKIKAHSAVGDCEMTRQLYVAMLDCDEKEEVHSAHITHTAFCYDCGAQLAIFDCPYFDEIKVCQSCGKKNHVEND